MALSQVSALSRPEISNLGIVSELFLKKFRNIQDNQTWALFLERQWHWNCLVVNSVTLGTNQSIFIYLLFIISLCWINFLSITLNFWIEALSCSEPMISHKIQHLFQFVVSYVGKVRMTGAYQFMYREPIKVATSLWVATNVGYSLVAWLLLAKCLPPAPC